MKLFLISISPSPPFASADQAADSQAAALGQSSQKPVSSNKHPDAQWFPDAGLGLFIHWGLASVGATGDLSWGMLANKPWKDQTVTPNTYYGWARQWKPDKVDYDAQLAQAKAAGFTYAVMVTKHHDGFTLWPSDFGDLGTKQFLGGRDFVKEFIAACRKHGLKVGLYYSPPDWWFDREYKSFAMRGPALDMDHKPVTLPKKPADHDAKRKALVTGQVTELLSNYGKIDLIWFDGGNGEIPTAEVRRLQPGIVVNRRNGGGGDYGDSEGQTPRQALQRLVRDLRNLLAVQQVVLHRGRGAGTPPRRSSKNSSASAPGAETCSPTSARRATAACRSQPLAAWKEMADWMKHSRESVIGAGPGPFPESVNAPVTTGKGVAYVHFLPIVQGGCHLEKRTEISESDPAAHRRIRFPSTIRTTNSVSRSRPHSAHRAWMW